MTKTQKRQLERIDHQLRQAKQYITDPATHICQETNAMLNDPNYYKNNEGKVIVSVIKGAGNPVVYLQNALEEVASLLKNI